MNNNKRKKMVRLGLLSDKAVEVKAPVKPVEEVKTVVVESQPLPVALKELPEEVVEQIKPLVDVQEQVVEKKKVAKVKKVVEEDKPSDV